MWDRWAPARLGSSPNFTPSLPASPEPDAQKGPALGLTLCCHHLELLLDHLISDLVLGK